MQRLKETFSSLVLPFAENSDSTVGNLT